MLNPFQTTFSPFFLYYSAYIFFSKKINASGQEKPEDPFNHRHKFRFFLHNSHNFGYLPWRSQPPAFFCAYRPFSLNIIRLSSKLCRGRSKRGDKDTKCSAETCARRKGNILGPSSKSLMAAEPFARACKDASSSQAMSTGS